ncbi:MAG: macro domain-containing protein [Candidatus Thermoplasmatota archaeon]|nr:macro domain-containing protein [Candidatus Thermoplasmatota archaeon]
MKKVEINGSIFELVQGDITGQDTEAVVNAANKRLAPGGGVAGAIHRAAGPELYEECKKLGGCETGDAKITKGYELPTEYVIHTVGPVYSGTEKDEEDLRSSYRRSLEVAVKNDVDSVSFPALSTGAFGYPTEEAAEVALDEIKNFLEKDGEIDLVRMVLYGKEDYEIHMKIFESMFL